MFTNKLAESCEVRMDFIHLVIHQTMAEKQRDISKMNSDILNKSLQILGGS